MAEGLECQTKVFAPNSSINSNPFMTFEPGREMTEFLTLGSSVWKRSAGWIERAGEAVRRQGGGSHRSLARSGGGLVEEGVGGKEQG